MQDGQSGFYAVPYDAVAESKALAERLKLADVVLTQYSVQNFTSISHYCVLQCKRHMQCWHT